ncbi:MAG: hypothetical protein ACK4K2_04380 [Dehalococcoidia bacterium]
MKAFVLLLWLSFTLIACRAAYPTPTPSPTPAPQQPAAQLVATPTPTPSPSPTPAAPAAVSPTPAGTRVEVSPHAQLGNILTDAQGRTLYLFTLDSPNTTTCTGACAQNWPPLLTAAAPVAGERVNPALLGTIRRPEGSTQVTYNGWPLYYFVADRAPGDAKGQGVRGVWFVVSPAGTPITPPTPTPTAAPTPSPSPLPQEATPTPTMDYRY